MDLRNAIAARFHVQVPATVTFDYPTLAALAEFLMANAAVPIDKVQSML